MKSTDARQFFQQMLLQKAFNYELARNKHFIGKLLKIYYIMLTSVEKPVEKRANVVVRVINSFTVKFSRLKSKINWRLIYNCLRISRVKNVYLFPLLLQTMLNRVLNFFTILNRLLHFIVDPKVFCCRSIDTVIKKGCSDYALG